MAIIMQQQWASDQLPGVTLDAENEPAQTIGDGIVSSAYAGTCSGAYRTKPSREAASEATRHKQDNHPHRSQDTSE